MKYSSVLKDITFLDVYAAARWLVVVIMSRSLCVYVSVCVCCHLNSASDWSNMGMLLDLTFANTDTNTDIEPNIEPYIEPNIGSNIEFNILFNIEPNSKPNIEPNIEPQY